MTNPNLLYLGTEFGTFASIDRGATWLPINSKSLPTVAIHEIAQATTAPEIVAATHGRSLWVLDVTTLRQLKPEHLKGSNELFAPTAVTRWRLDFTHEGMFRTGTREFIGQNPPRGATFDYVLGKKGDKLSLKVFDINGSMVRELDLAKEKDPGFHRVSWDLVSGSPPKEEKGKSPKGRFTPGQPVVPAVYRVVLEIDGVPHARSITIEADPRTRTPGSLTNEAEELRRLLRERP
jgi:hypothetical protein